MANHSAVKAKEPRIEVHKPVLFSGMPVATFIPALSQAAGGDIHAIIYHQLHYLSRDDYKWEEYEEADDNYEIVEDLDEYYRTHVSSLFEKFNKSNDNCLQESAEVVVMDHDENGVPILEGEYQPIDGSHDDAEEEEFDSISATGNDSEEFVPDETEPVFKTALDYYDEEELCGYEVRRSRRISFSGLQRQLPFVSTRWIKFALDELEEKEFIEVKRSKRVNVYSPNFPPTQLVHHIVLKKALPDAYSRKYIVLPILAQKIGLKAALVLQQIHLRTFEGDGSIVVIRSYADWHCRTFPFWSIATLKRIFKRLQELNLIIVKPYRREDDGSVNSYRVNYIGLAEVVGLPIPQIENPFEPAGSPGCHGCPGGRGSR